MKFKALRKLLDFFVVVLFGGITVITMLQVFFRYVLNAPLMWSEEFARYLFIWGVLLAAGIGIGKGSHIGVEVLIDRLPDFLRGKVRFLSSVLIIIFSAFLIYYGIDLVSKVMRTQSPALKIPMGFVYSAVPVCSVIWLFFSVRKLIADIRNPEAAGGFEEEENERC